MIKRYFCRCAWIACLLIPAGCGNTPPAQFYTLNPLQAASAQASPLRLPDEVALGIGPVAFPEFLDRPQIVVRSTANRIEVDEFNRWGGSLPEDFTRTLVQNISVLLGSNRVYAYPSRGGIDIAYRVAVDVQQFDGRPGAGVTLNAVWTLVDQNTDKVLVVRRFEFLAPASEGFEGLVAAHDVALAELSREMAGVVRTLAGRR